MSDRIIRAASVRQVRSWQPQALAAGMPAAVRAPSQRSAPQPSQEPSLFTPEQEEQIRQALEQAHARGIEAGMQQGFEQGFAQGLEQAEAAFAAQQQQGAQVQGDQLLGLLEQALNEINAQNDALSAQMPQWITQMALAVARQVVGEAALKNAADIERRIHAAVENVQESLRGNLQLLMHPETQKQLAALKTSGAQSLMALVRTDDSMTPGGFVLRTSHGEENHSIQSRWQRVVETFSSDVKHQRFI